MRISRDPGEAVGEVGKRGKSSRRGMGRKKSGSCGGPGLGTPPPKCPGVEALVGRSQTGLSGPAGGCRGLSEALTKEAGRAGGPRPSPPRGAGTWGVGGKGKGRGSALTSTRANLSSSSQGSGIGILPGGGSSETEGGSPGPPSALSRLPIAAGPPRGPQPPTSTPGGPGLGLLGLGSSLSARVPGPDSSARPRAPAAPRGSGRRRRRRAAAGSGTGAGGAAPTVRTHGRAWPLSARRPGAAPPRHHRTRPPARALSLPPLRFLPPTPGWDSRFPHERRLQPARRAPHSCRPRLPPPASRPPGQPARPRLRAIGARTCRSQRPPPPAASRLAPSAPWRLRAASDHSDWGGLSAWTAEKWIRPFSTRSSQCMQISKT